MKILETGDQRVAGIVRKKIRPDKYYRLSAYTYIFSENDEHLILNTMTGTTAALSEAEHDLVVKVGKQPVSGAELSEKGFEDFISNCFLVEEKTDNYHVYEQTVSVLKMLSGEKPGTKSYTILPTTGCNARCVYCYEEGMPVYSMNEETADRVADFIEETRWQDTVRLIWFGGEPLVGSRTISRICRRLHEKSIPFRSKIITNATLMTEELLEEAIVNWHLESAQVSVDGKRNDYEERKQFVYPAVRPYDAMMEAVGRMLERGIRVTLRCNYDRGNLDGLQTFFDDVNRRFGNRENLSIYPAMLFQAQADESGVDLYRDARRIDACIRKLNLKDRSKKKGWLKVNLCGADSGDKSVVIAPDGRLYHCEHLPGNTSFGSIFDPQISIHSDERALLPADEYCKNCCFLPKCTSFFKNGCVDYFAGCFAFRQIETNEALRRMIQESASKIQDDE